jgi:hypothetical protein
MYIDPGSGAFVWQAVMFAVSGVVYHFRNSLKQLVSKIVRSRKEDAEGL